MVINDLTRNDFSISSPQSTMQFSRALLLLSGSNNVMCRRETWGETVRHIYIEEEHLLIIDESGGLSFFMPSIEELRASDWIVLHL
jgi:hypothetical protein